MHQSQLQHARHIKRRQKSLKRYLHILRGDTAQFGLPIHFRRRFLISVSLLLLFANGRSLRFGLYWRRFGCGLRLYWLFLFFRDIPAQLAIRSKQPPVGNRESLLSLISHELLKLPALFGVVW